MIALTDNSIKQSAFAFVLVCMVCAVPVLYADTPASASGETAGIALPLPEQQTAQQPGVPPVQQQNSEILPEIDPKTGFPVIRNKPFVVFSEGFSAALVTRIVKQEKRSNFVFEDFMPGAWFGIETKNMRPLNSTVRVAAYYPYSFKFNGVPQIPKNVIRYAVDVFAGVLFEPDMWNYVRFNISPGIHFLFQNTDRFNYCDLGIAGLVGVELPLLRRWTIVLNGLASFDYGNLGTNATMEPYDYVWQYQLDIGIRYSKKAENRYFYIRPKKRP